MIAEDLKQDPRRVRLWLMVNRQNKTIRPDQPIMDLAATVEETFTRASAQRDLNLRVWAEVADEVDQDGNAVWPSWQSHPGEPIVKSDNILLLLKHFDSDAQSLNGAGHVYISKERKVEELTPLIMQRMGWGEQLPANEKLMLWEEIKPTMVEALKPKQTLKMAELQDGDIICFQKVSTDAERQEKVSQQTSFDRFEDAREYYDFLEHKRLVRYHPHPTRCDTEQYQPFELVLNSKITYDMMSERVATHLGVPATHIRFWTVNAASSNPKAPVRRGTNPTLRQILNPMGTSALNSSLRPDAFFFEVLDMSLDELDTKKSIKVTWVSEGITKEDQFDLLVPKTGNMEDLIQALIKKAKIADEAEGGRIRIYEASSNRFYREPTRDHPVLNLNEYTQIFAERIPKEEEDCNPSDLISVFHFQNEVSRMHGIPFRFLMVEGEKFVDTKKRLEKRTGLKGKSFEKIKFAVVRRANYSKPQYLSDDDELIQLVNPEDDLLGLDHLDRTRTLRNGVGDLFLR